MNNTLIIYISATLFLIWLLAFFAYFISKKRQQKKLLDLRNNWGKQDHSGRNFDLIENFSLLTTNPFYHQLTPQTVTDIDLYDLFTFIDRTTSKPGQQYLFN